MKTLIILVVLSGCATTGQQQLSTVPHQDDPIELVIRFRRSLVPLEDLNRHCVAVLVVYGRRPSSAIEAAIDVTTGHDAYVRLFMQAFDTRMYGLARQHADELYRSAGMFQTNVSSTCSEAFKAAIEIGDAKIAESIRQARDEAHAEWEKLK